MRSVAATVIVFITLTTALQAQSSVQCPTVNYPKTIRGMVRLSSNAPAPQGILVRLRDRTRVEVNRQQLDSRGKFEFSGLPANVYTVEISERGYFPVEETYELVCQTSAYSDITLRPNTKEIANIPPEGPTSTVSANAPQKEESMKELEAGQAILAQDPKAAVSHFEHVTKLEPEYVSAYLLLSTAQLLSGDFDAAIQTSDTALKLKPTSSQAYMLRGMALGFKNDLPGAQDSLKRSVELNPQSYDAQLELGKVYLGARQLKDAQTALKKASELSPKEPFPHVLLGNAMLGEHDAKGALAQFKQAVELAPQGPMAPVLKQKIQTLEQGPEQQTTPKKK